MDIGTRREPGRELGKAEVKEISGGNLNTMPDDIPSDSPGVVPTGGPVDYTNGG